MFNTQCPVTATAAASRDRLQQRRLHRDLRATADANEFTLHYQPRLTLRNGRHVATDVTIRWTHRRRGTVSPGSFAGAVEASGLGSAIGGRMLRAACVQAAGWTGTRNVNVPVTSRQFSEQLLPRQLAAALEESGLPPERLELGLSEAMLLSDDLDLLLSLSALRDLGVGIVLEDFGQTYASLATLKRLPITALKLDRSLVRNVPTDREDAAMLRAILTASHAMGLTVIANGIETETQRAFLSSCNCDEGMGPLFSHPLPESALHTAGYS